MSIGCDCGLFCFIAIITKKGEGQSCHHLCDYTDISCFFPSNTYAVYCKSMILVLDTIEDEEIYWEKDNICAQAVQKMHSLFIVGKLKC